jgi:N6-adenosine-specific RNA methylase IME4
MSAHSPVLANFQVAQTGLAVSPGCAFSCVVADPPWQVKAGPNGGGYATREGATGKWNWRRESLPARPLAYPTMSVEEIAALQVARVCADDAHLYLWTINRYVEAAYTVARAWGFEPSTLLTWAKKPMGGGLGGTYGISTEHCLFARRGSLKAKMRITGTWFPWKREYVNGAPAHSRKPAAFMEMVEAVSPGPYLELFARRKREGWSVWGNEVTSDISLDTHNMKISNPAP